MVILFVNPTYALLFFQIIAALVASGVAVISSCWFLALAADDWELYGGDLVLDAGGDLGYEV